MDHVPESSPSSPPPRSHSRTWGSAVSMRDGAVVGTGVIGERAAVQPSQGSTHTTTHGVRSTAMSQSSAMTWRMHGHGVSTTAPACHGHSAVAYGPRIYVYGGDAKDNKRISSFHEYNLETESWKKVDCSGTKPDPRAGHTAAVYRDTMLVFGGRDGRTHFADLFSFNLVSRRWNKVETRGALVKRRYRHSMCMFDDKMYVFGGEFAGENGQCYNDFHEFAFETNTWNEVVAVSGEPPEPRSGHTVVVHEGSMYVFGGRDKTPRYFRDIHRFDFRTRSWSLIKTRGGVEPPRVYNHASFKYRNSFYVFGGYGSRGETTGPRIGHRYSELYEFSFEHRCWSIVHAGGRYPTARLGHSITRVDDTFFLFGGWDRNGYRSDLHSITFQDLMLNMYGQMRNSALYDMVVEVDSHKLAVHRAVLSVRCPKFAEMIRAAELNEIEVIISECSLEDGGEGESGPGSKGAEHAASAPDDELFMAKVKRRESVTLPPAEAGRAHVQFCEHPLHMRLSGVSYSVFCLLLEYLYTGSLPSDSLDVLELLPLAEKFELERCKVLCAVHIKEHITPATVLSVLQAAYRFKNEEVKDFCFMFISQNYDAVAYSDEVQQLPHELLVEFARIPTSTFQASHTLSKFFMRDTIPQSRLRDDLNTLMNNPMWSDVRFVVEGDVVHAHKFLLLGTMSGTPTAFARMFDSGMKESITNEVVLEDVPRACFTRLMEFLYLGAIELSSTEEAVELLGVADRFLVEELKEKCARYVKTQISVENVLSILHVADRCCLSELKAMSLDLIGRNFREVCSSGDLGTLNRGLLVEIIQTHAWRCGTVQ